jgi:hypothetical protein
VESFVACPRRWYRCTCERHLGSEPNGCCATARSIWCCAHAWPANRSPTWPGRTGRRPRLELALRAGRPTPAPATPRLGAQTVQGRRCRRSLVSPGGCPS